jgi:hypothetical protein
LCIKCKKWEYCSISVSYINKSNEEMDKLGAEEWELVTVDNSRAYLKREVQNT